MFGGSIVALITPMHRDGTIDYENFCQLIEWHIVNQTDGLVILGSTGEAPTIEAVERSKMIEIALTQAKGRIPIIVGTGDNATVRAIHKTKEAMQLGADGALVVTPYYNRPTQEGLFQHFFSIAKAVPIPQILYNVPGRTGCDLLPATVERLAPISNIVGIKDATGEIERVAQLKNMEHPLDLLSGDDNTAAEFVQAGGKGAISVVGNAHPKLFRELIYAASKGNSMTVNQYKKQLTPLFQAAMVESNPIPIKWMLTQMGLIEAGIRLPLTPLKGEFHQFVREAMQAAGIA